MQHRQAPPKKDFGTAPSNYVPGFGRGAVGFITRSDIGPARLEGPIAATPIRGQTPAPRPIEDEDRDNEVYNDAKYDEWNGYQIPLFNMGDYDEEDREADQVYTFVDERMDERRRTRKEIEMRKELMRIRSEKPNLAQQFSDLKRDLAKVTVDEWMSIPEAGDYKIKKEKRERFTPVPDSVLDSARQSAGFDTKVSESNLNQIGEARGTLLSLKLDRISDSVSGQSVVDRRGYLTDLASIPMASEAEIGDFKKARLLLKSVIQTDPKNSFGWIAAARVEELDGKLQAARNILAQGLQHVEDSEDIWIECARLETADKGKQILAKAVSIMPNSVKIWLAAANKETDKTMKCKILKRALEFVPNSVDLWKELIELSSENEAKILLHKAVECIPTNLQLWLALAKLESYENAKAVLNKARQYLPQEPSIWIHASKLEESAGKDKIIISQVLGKGIKVLAKNGMKIVREDWLTEAEMAERSENYQTCYAIIRAAAGYGVEDDKLEETWIHDAKIFEERNSIFTARGIFMFAVEVLEEKENSLNNWIEFESRHSGTKQVPEDVEQFLLDQQKQDEGVNAEQLVIEQTQRAKIHWYFDDVLQLAIQKCPKVESFWVRAILRAFDLDHQSRVQKLIDQANQEIPNNENLLVLAGKLQTKAGNMESAFLLFTKAQQVCQGLKSWIALIKLMLTTNDTNLEQLTLEACKKYPHSDKIWVLAARVQAKKGNLEKVRKIYESGVNANPASPQLWMSYIQHESNLGLYSRARPILERAKQKLQKCPELWVTAVRLEIDANNRKGAVFMLNKGLQECPRYGELWALAIELEPKNTRKMKSADAVTACVDNPYVYLSTAKIFWKENKIEKCKRWIEKALLLDSRLGDAWTYLYLLIKINEPQSLEELVRKCVERKPKGGLLWNQVKKSENGFRMSYKELLEETSKLIEKEINKIE